MYLSKVHLSWAALKNPYEQHRALWCLFPNQENASRSFLYRIEQVSRGQGGVALMLSKQKPQVADLSGGPELLAVKALGLTLMEGQHLRFRLRANPIKMIKDERKGEYERNGKRYTRTARVPLIHDDQQQAWLERKLAQAAEIQALNIQQELPLNFRKKKEARSGKIQPVLFEGVLAVKDTERLLTLLYDGVGPAKAFGCGLLSVAPV